jgi:hypothetical protein
MFHLAGIVIITVTATIITITITAIIITISPGLHTRTFVQNQWEAGCRFHWEK